MTTPNDQYKTELVPQLYALIENPGLSATPEQYCLFNLTARFYQRIQEAIEDEHFKQWMAVRNTTTESGAQYFRVLFWNDIMLNSKETILVATQKFKDMMDEIGIEAMRKLMENPDGLALERLFGMLSVKDEGIVGEENMKEKVL